MSTLRAKLVWREAALKTIAKVQDNIRTKAPTSYGPMNNTGNAADSLRYRWVDDTRLQIYSDMAGARFNYIMTLETGRKPGKQPPTAPIEKWLQERGIQPPDITQKSLAFLIARKIGREGSMVYRQGGNTGIISEVQSNDWIVENFIKPIEQDLKKEILKTMNTI